MLRPPPPKKNGLVMLMITSKFQQVLNPPSSLPVPKRPNMKWLNDYRPVAFTPTAMKCFKKLMLSHIRSLVPADLDNYRFVYWANHSVEDAITTALHTALTHSEELNRCVRMLFIL